MSIATHIHDRKPQPLSFSAVGRVSPWIHLLMAGIYLAFLTIVIQALLSDPASREDRSGIYIRCGLVIYLAGYLMREIWKARKDYLAMTSFLPETEMIASFPAQNFGDSSSASDSTFHNLLWIGLFLTLIFPDSWKFLTSGHDPQRTILSLFFFPLLWQKLLSFQQRQLQLLDSGIFWKQLSVSEFIPWEAIQNWSIRFTPIRSILTLAVVNQQGKLEEKQIAIPYLNEEEIITLSERLRKYCGQPVEFEKDR